MFMVVFTSAEGKPSHHLTETLDEGLKFVEHLHNSEGVGDARLYQMTEVPIHVKTIYRVELAGAPNEAPEDLEPVSSTGA